MRDHFLAARTRHPPLADTGISRARAGHQFALGELLEQVGGCLGLSDEEVGNVLTPCDKGLQRKSGGHASWNWHHLAQEQEATKKPVEGTLPSVSQPAHRPAQQQQQQIQPKDDDKGE